MLEWRLRGCRTIVVDYGISAQLMNVWVINFTHAVKCLDAKKNHSWSSWNVRALPLQRLHRTGIIDFDHFAFIAEKRTLADVVIGSERRVANLPNAREERIRRGECQTKGGEQAALSLHKVWTKFFLQTQVLHEPETRT